MVKDKGLARRAAAEGEGGRAGTFFPKPRHHVCNGTPAGFAKAPGQKGGPKKKTRPIVSPTRKDDPVYTARKEIEESI